MLRDFQTARQRGQDDRRELRMRALPNAYEEGQSLLQAIARGDGVDEKCAANAGQRPAVDLRTAMCQ